jgi:hypothetical protein
MCKAEAPPSAEHKLQYIKDKERMVQIHLNKRFGLAVDEHLPILG